jgi:1-acyl-sn-glycerol-3-phosphate acyltransferase
VRSDDEYDPGPPVVWWLAIRLLDVGARVLGSVQVTGGQHLPRHGAALLAANHVSAVDPLVLLVVAHRHGRKVRFLGVQELHGSPLVGWLVRAGRHIPVVQNAPSRAALQAAEHAVRAGELVLVYPEGTIPADGVRVAAKGGIGLLALRTGAPVVPLRSRGLERSRVAAWRPWRRLRVSVSVGPPVELPDVTGLRGGVRYAAVGDAVLAAVRRL